MKREHPKEGFYPTTTHTSYSKANPKIEALFEACCANDIALIRQTIDEGADVANSSSSYLKTTLLSMACREGRKEIVELLIDKGYVDLAKPDNGEATPFMYACCSTSDDTADLLATKYNVDVNYANSYGNTALHWASFHWCEGTVKLLITKWGADVNKVNQDGETPLYVACNCAHIGIVAILLTAKGIDVNKPDKHGETPLYVVCENGNVTIAKLLAEHGADVNIKSGYGVPPLFKACQNGHREIAKFLVETCHADVNATTVDEKETSLWIACCMRYYDIAKTLIATGLCNTNDRGFDTFVLKWGIGALELLVHENIWPQLRAFLAGVYKNPESPLAAFLGFKHIVDYIHLINVPDIIRKQYPERELH